MMAWNFDISEAPKGEWVDSHKTVGKTVVMQCTHVPEYIIAAGNSGVVTLSKWLPNEDRWNMFSKNTPPIAWMPWPKHPNEVAE